jgi:uncharacterized protein (DUF885 family)
MRVVLTVLVAALSLLPQGCTERTTERSGGATSALEQLFSDEWQARMENSPLFATAAGDHRYNDRLDDVSAEAHGRREQSAKEFLARLEPIDRGVLSATDRVNYDIFKRMLNQRIAGYRFNTHLMPITNRNGFHTSFPQLPDQVPLATVLDYENYISRLRGFHRYTQQHIQLMKEGIAAGYVLPRVVLEGYEPAMESHIVDDPTESLLRAPTRLRHLS